MDALSPLDGRYADKVDALRFFFSEEALMRGRVFIEVSYFAALAAEKGIRELTPLSEKQQALLQKIVDDFDAKEAEKVRAIEKETNHDVKAIEYYLGKKIRDSKELKNLKTEFIHFGLTSEDINNLAYGILIHSAIETVIKPELRVLMVSLHALAKSAEKHDMLSLTHGQPATPTTLGKELFVFVERLERQHAQLEAFNMQGKFGGAVGTYAAHKAAYPHVKWEKFGEELITSLGLIPLTHTTQINPHDDIAELSHIMMRINAILLDLSRDVWLYISRGVFKQKAVKGEVGSSTMPHKINPIDFENAEGNLGISSALFAHFAEKLPISRLQRDLSDSTVQRNIGVAFGHHLLAITSFQKGFARVTVDAKRLKAELSEHPEVHAEAIQTVMRKHGDKEAYEKMKKMTRGQEITRKNLQTFVGKLKIPAEEKSRLLKILQ